MRSKNTIPMTRQIKGRLRENGNVFLALFGAVAIVGVIGGTAAGIMKGPMKVMSDVSSRAVAENEIMANTKMGIMAIAQSAYTKDCDNDGTVEPYPYVSDNTGKTGGVPTGGGYLPSEIETTRWTDPWGNSYTYCVWDHGTLVDDATCGGAGQNRLPGLNTTTYPAGDVNKQVSLAVISAGANRRYETTCQDWATADANADGDLDDIGDTSLVNKPIGSDDIVMSYTYAEAAMATSSNWRIQSNDITTAEITEDEVEIGGQTAGGGGVTATIGGSASALGGLKLASDPGDNSITGACNPANDQALRINTGGASKALEICDGGTWTPISGSSTTNQCEITMPVIANSGNAWVQSSLKLNSAVALALSGNYAFVTSLSFAHNSFTTIDLSDPLNPVIANGGNAWIQEPTKLGSVFDIEISGNYAFVTAYNGNALTVVDITDPLNPVIANGGNAWVQDATKLDGAASIAISGNYAFVTAGNGNALTVVDITDPLNPVIANGGNAWVQDATKLDGAFDIEISGNYAFVTANNGNALTVVDITDPLNPVIANGGNAWVQDATKLDGAFDIEISGNYAFVTAYNGNALTVVDITDPLNPVIANGGNAWIQDATKLNAIRGVSLSGNYALAVANLGNALTVVDITDPLNPVIANGGNAWVQDATKLSGPFDIKIFENYAVIVNFLSNSLTVIDLGCDPTNPVAPITGTNIGFDPELANCVAGNDGPLVQLDTFAGATGTIGGLWGDGQYLYVPGGPLTVLTFDGSTFTEVTTTNTPTNVLNVFGHDGYIYVNTATEIEVYSFNGSNFTLLDSEPLDNSAGIANIVTDGQYIYSGASGGAGEGLYAYSFDGTTLTQAGYFGTDGVSGISIQNGVLLINTEDASLNSFLKAVSFDGSNFTEIASTQLVGFHYTMQSDDNYIYLNTNTFVEILSFDGESITSVYKTVLPHSSQDLFFDGRYFYSTDFGGGQGILHIHEFDGHELNLIEKTPNSPVITASVWSDGTYIYVGDLGVGMHAYSGYECTKAGEKTPGAALQYDYTTEQLFEVPTSASAMSFGFPSSASAESYGTAILLKSDEFGDEAGFSVNVDSALGDDEIPHSAITAARAGINGEGALLFKTQDSDGNLNTNMMFDKDGDLGINTSAPFNVSGKIQIGDLASSGSDFFDPELANCVANNDGPFVEAGSFPVPASTLGVWSDESYVYIVNGTGIRAYTFDGTTFTEEGNFDTPDTAFGVWGDGTYIYVADFGSGVRAYTFDGTTFTEEGDLDTTGNTFDVWGDGTYIYIADYSGGVRAYTFNGTTFTLLDSFDTPGIARGVWGDGTYIYIADDSSGLHALSFDGSTFTLLNSYGDLTKASKIWGDGTHLYVADDTDGIQAFTFDGSVLTKKGSLDTPANANDVWGDGIYIYLADGSNGVTVYTFDGTTFTEEGNFNTPNNAFGIWGDGSYIYIADSAAGLRAYSGFECTAVDGWQGPTRGLLTSIGEGSCDTSSFAPIDTYDTVISSGDVWGDGTYIYNADFLNLEAYSFDGTTLTQAGIISTVTYKAHSVWSDGTNIYTGGSELVRYTFNGTTFTQAATSPTGDDPGNHVKPWGDGTYVYSGKGVELWAHDPTTLSKVGTEINTASNLNNIWGDGTYIFTTHGTSGIQAHTFNGTIFTAAGSFDTDGTAKGIGGDGTYIYVADGTSGLTAFTHDGTNFTQIGNIATPTPDATEVWADNGSIYVADNTGGVSVYTFDGTNFTELVTYDTTGNAVRIWGDGTYIYVADGTSGVSAFPYLSCGESFTGAIGFFGNDGVGDVDTNVLFSTGLGIKGTNADGSTLTDILSIDAQGTTTFEQGTVGLLDEAGAFEFLSSSSIADTTPSLTLNRSRGSEFTPLTVSSGDILGALTWAGYDGTGIAANGNSAIYAKATGAPSNSVIPNGLFFSTDSAGDALGSSDLALLSTGLIGIGTESPLEELHVAGRIAMSEGLKLGYDNKCKVTHDQGFMRYVASDSAVEYCTAREWISITQKIPNIGFDPEAANCTRNAGGPFREIISETDSIIGFPWAIWSDGPYVYASDSNRLRVYNFDGVILTEINMVSGGSTIYDIWGDGTYIYTAQDTSGIHAYTFDGSTLTQVGVLDTAGEAKELYSDGTYIYLADDTNGLIAYSFDGSTFTEEGSFATVADATDVWADENYIYLVDQGTGLIALTFDGSTFTSVGTFVPPTPNWGEVWSDGTYIYYADFEELYALTFNGSGFTQNGWIEPDPISGVRDIWGDGTYIYTSNNGKFSAYSFDGTAFTLKEEVDTTPADHHTIWGDGTYIYMAIPNPVGELGFKIYSGYECLSTEVEGELIAWDGIENTELKITASDGAAGDEFGFSVDIEGQYMVVGARYENSSQGAAYVYDIRSGTELFKLTASDGAASDGFGYALDVSGNYAVIGAHLDDDNGSASGSAYVFDITTGAELQKLTPSDGAAIDEFGHAIAVDGNIAIINSSNDNDNGALSGSVYVFDIITGTQIRKITASDGAVGDRFGSRYLDLEGNIAAIPSFRDDDNGADSGSVYIFNIDTGDELFKLKPSDGAAGDSFGSSTKLSNNYAIISSTDNDDNGIDSGSAYIFDITTGAELRTITPSDGAAGDEFTHAIDVDGKYAVITAHYDDDNGADSGSAYIFDITTGEQLHKLTPSDGAAGDDFGFRNVSIDGNRIAVPSYKDDDNGADSGSVYIYQGNWTDRHTSGVECYPDPFEFDDIYDINPEEDHATNTVTITGNVKNCTITFAYDTTEQFFITKNAISEPDGTYFIEVSAGDTIRVDLVNGLSGEVKPLIATLGDYRTMSTVTTP